MLVTYNRALLGTCGWPRCSTSRAWVRGRNMCGRWPLHLATWDSSVLFTCCIYIWSVELEPGYVYAPCWLTWQCEAAQELDYGGEQHGGSRQTQQRTVGRRTMVDFERHASAIYGVRSKQGRPFISFQIKVGGYVVLFSFILKWAMYSWNANGNSSTRNTKGIGWKRRWWVVHGRLIKGVTDDHTLLLASNKFIVANEVMPSGVCCGLDMVAWLIATLF